MQSLALYIHWPFCLSKCPYCDFNSHVSDAIPQARYKAALLQELEWTREKIGPRALTSIFFGGGTPSLMPPETVSALIERAQALFPPAGEIEITLEANPTSVEAEKFRAFRAAGVNRVSIGVQSLVPEHLEFLGRKHSGDEARKAIALAANIFPRYSFDLIYALPHQTPQMWEKELREALPLSRGHLSLYQLTIEENTAFHHDYHVKKSFLLPPEESAEVMYTLTQNLLEAASMPAYEVSNHASPGQASRHNLTYWNYGEYAGIGPGAHGRIHQDHVSATQAIKSPTRWLESVEAKGHGMEMWDTIDETTRYEEQLMMRLRLTSSIPYSLLQSPHAGKKLALLEAQGLAVLATNGFTITPRGRLVLTSLTAFLIEK